MSGTESVVYALGVLGLSAVLLGWLVRHVVGRVEDAASRAAESHILIVTERERVERLLAEAREIRTDCYQATAAAVEAVGDLEELVESADLDGDEEDEFDLGKGDY